MPFRVLFLSGHSLYCIDCSVFYQPKLSFAFVGGYCCVLDLYSITFVGEGSLFVPQAKFDFPSFVTDHGISDCSAVPILYVDL